MSDDPDVGAALTGQGHNTGTTPGPFTPLTQEQHDALMWDTPVVKGADPELNLDSFGEPNGNTPEYITGMLDDMLRRSPKGALRGWSDIDAFQHYLKNLPDDVDAHDMKDGTYIFKLKDKAYTS